LLVNSLFLLLVCKSPLFVLPGLCFLRLRNHALPEVGHHSCVVRGVDEKPLTVSMLCCSKLHAGQIPTKCVTIFTLLLGSNFLTGT
jgi:hypothetical protein